MLEILAIAVGLSVTTEVIATRQVTLPTGYTVEQCVALPADEAEATLAAIDDQEWVVAPPSEWQRRKAATPSAKLGGARPASDDAFVDGYVPHDWTDPIARTIETRAPDFEFNVHIPAVAGELQLVNVGDFRAPSNTRRMLVRLVPESGAPGLYLRPYNPFAEFTVDHSIINMITPLSHDANMQAAYISDGYGYDPDTRKYEGKDQYLWITQDMDPAPAGKHWYIAAGQFRDAAEVRGRVEIYLLSEPEQTPFGIRLLFSADEQAQQTGMFDATPRVPNGLNPGATLGEARRWAIYWAAEQILDELDFQSPFPATIAVRMVNEPELPIGFAGSRSVNLDHRFERPLGGRLKRYYGNTGGFWTLPAMVVERESGTDLCRAIALGGQSRCGEEHARILGTISFNEIPGTAADWTYNPDITRENIGNPNFVTLAAHEIIHVLGVGSAVQNTLYYIGGERTEWFSRFTGAEKVAIDPSDEKFFAGPRTVAHDQNLRRTTPVPGVMWDTHDNAHIANDPYWWEVLPPTEAPDQIQLMATSTGRFWRGVGLAKPILEDAGYALGGTQVQDRALPRQWYDRSRSGHGIDFRRVTRPDGSHVHFLHFYTYDADGNPEWYMAVGEVDDNAVFVPWDGLQRFTYDENREPKQQADPARSGDMRLLLDPPRDHPACAHVFRREDWPTKFGDRFADTWLVAVFEWELDGESGAWCMEPIEFGDQRAFPLDSTGSWYVGGDDSGWGISLMHRNFAWHPILVAMTYFYDADGEPTWSWGAAGANRDIENMWAARDGVDIEMLYFKGFCRSCNTIPTSNQPIGTLRLSFEEGEPVGAGMIEYWDVTIPGQASRRWHRADTSIQLLSSPHPNVLR